MKITFKQIQMTVCLATCAATLLVGGCATSGYDKGNKAAADIQTAANRIAALPDQIDKTLAALDELVNKPQTDLRPQFKQFTADLHDVQSAAIDIAAARRSMGEQSKEFFATWDAQLAKINNEDIKARSLERRSDVNQQLATIKRSYAEAEIAFRPFLADLQDVQKYLSVDLTAGGLAAIQPTVTRAHAGAAQLTANLTQLAEQFRALGLAMSSVTPAAK